MADDWLVNYNKHPNLIHSRTGKPMELDFFSPSLRLAIEYQGMQHYQTGWRIVSHLEEQQMRDQEKRIKCQENQIYLLEIDCRDWEKLDSHPAEKYRVLISQMQAIGTSIVEDASKNDNDSLTAAWMRALSNLNEFAMQLNQQRKNNNKRKRSSLRRRKVRNTSYCTRG